MKVPLALLPAAISALLLLPHSVHAQGASQDGASQEEGPSPAVRKLADDGLQLFNEGKYAEAAALLEQAQSQYPAPAYLLYIGRSYQKLGKLVEACERYAAAAGMEVPAAASKDLQRKFEKAKERAAAELADLTRTIPTVMLVVNGPTPNLVHVKSERSPLRILPLPGGFLVQMNAGDHDLRIEAPGFVSTGIPIRGEPRRRDGAPVSVTVTLTRAPAAESSQGQTAPPSASSGTPSAPARPTLDKTRDGNDGDRSRGTLSHRMQPGLYARGDFQVTHGGGVAVLGLSFAVHDFIEPYVGALLGRNVGVEPGICGYFLRGALKPRLDVAVPIFFEDKPYAGLRASGGVQWDPFRNFGIFAQVGGAFFPDVPPGYNSLVFLPSVGVQGRL